MVVPFAPPLLNNPVVNPKVGGYLIPYPYISVSQYKFAPTAMDPDSLVDGGDERAQIQALADIIRRVSGEADRYCFGSDPAGKGASICASQNVDDAYVKVLQGEPRLVCDYHPILELDALAIGSDPSVVQPINQLSAGRIRFGKTVIFVPTISLPLTPSGPGNPAPLLPINTFWSNRLYCIWTYINGYPHTYLTETATQGTQTVDVAPTTPTGGLCGVYPGTQFRIVDNEFTEEITVESVSGTTITTSLPLLYTHEPPETPDFIPVTTLPADVEDALILMTTASIKTRGDSAVEISEIGEPVEKVKGGFDYADDQARAWEKLDRYRSVTKIKS